jgi:hypothetical protein
MRPETHMNAGKSPKSRNYSTIMKKPNAAPVRNAVPVVRVIQTAVGAVSLLNAIVTVSVNVAGTVIRIFVVSFCFTTVIVTCSACYSIC